MKELRPHRILWLSDIHHKSDYSDYRSIGGDYGIKNFFGSFFDILTQISNEPEQNPIETVIITGDLAHAGTESEYLALERNVINRIKTTLGAEVKIFTIPGNHDVERTNVEAIYDELAARKISLDQRPKKIYETKKRILSEAQGYYEKLFQHYTRFAKRINSNIGLKGSNQANDNRLFGFSIDRDKKIVYFLINTAWFCLSKPLEDINIEHLLTTVDIASSKESLKAEIKKLIGANRFVSETGGQLIGHDLFDYNMLKDILEDSQYHNYVKVTLMHHPFHWLRWEEVYDYGGGQNLLLSDLIRESDLILTGHEHVPEYIEATKISEKAWHVPAGMFLHHNLRGAFEEDDHLFPHNRFSVLTVYGDRAEESRYLYNVDDNVWRKRAKSSVMPFQREYFPDTYAFEGILSNFLIDFIPNAKNYFRNHKSLIINELSGFHFSNNEVKFKAFEGEQRVWLIFCPTTKNYYREILHSADHTSYIDSVIEHAIEKFSSRSISVVFFSLDLVVNPELYGQPVSGVGHQHHKMRERRFGLINQEADVHFDRFRHFFFKRNESRDFFGSLARLQFVNIVVPYWRAELLKSE